MSNHSRTVNLSPEASEDLIEIWGYLARKLPSALPIVNYTELTKHAQG